MFHFAKIKSNWCCFLYHLVNNVDTDNFFADVVKSFQPNIHYRKWYIFQLFPNAIVAKLLLCAHKIIDLNQNTHGGSHILFLLLFSDICQQYMDDVNCLPQIHLSSILVKKFGKKQTSHWYCTAMLHYQDYILSNWLFATSSVQAICLLPLFSNWICFQFVSDPPGPLCKLQICSWKHPLIIIGVK